MAILEQIVLLAAVLVMVTSVVATTTTSSTPQNNGNNNSRKQKQFLRHVNTVVDNAESTTSGESHRERRLRGPKSKKIGRKDDRERRLKSGKKDDKTTAGSLSFPIIPTTTKAPAPTAAPALTLQDWIDNCSVGSKKINNCNGNNVCKMCVKAVASISPEYYDSSIANCARNTNCKSCESPDLTPFFDCGLELEGKTVLVPTPPVDRVDGDSNNVIVDADVDTDVSLPDATLPEPPQKEKWDYINCPALFPGSGTDCVIEESYEYKHCLYPEKGPDAVCQCQIEQPTWSCTNVVMNFDPIEVEVTEEDLTIIVTEEGNGGGNGDGGNFLPVIQPIDVQVNELVDEGEVKTNICIYGLTPPKTGDECYSDGFHSIVCCYHDPSSPIEGATITCECVGEIGIFGCISGPESTCTVL